MNALYSRNLDIGYIRVLKHLWQGLFLVTGASVDLLLAKLLQRSTEQLTFRSNGRL